MLYHVTSTLFLEVSAHALTVWHVLSVKQTQVAPLANQQETETARLRYDRRFLSPNLKPWPARGNESTLGGLARRLYFGSITSIFGHSQRA